jgi:hypothetical protein
MLLRAFENLGLDATDIPRGAGLDEAKLEEPSARIAQEQFRLLIATAERASDDPLVVLRAARTSGFARLAADALTVSLEERKLLAFVRIDFTGSVPPSGRRYGTEYLAALCESHIRENVEGAP